LAAGLLTLNRALVGVFYDDGLYAGLATALSHGYGYVHPNLPGTPAAVHYPPVYPLLLAPLYGLLSVTGAAATAKVLNALLAACATGLIAWHAMRIEILGPASTRPWLAPAIVLAAALAIPVLATQGVLFAEPLFALLLVVAIVAIDRVDAPWIAGAATALAFLTRSIAIAIVAGGACFLLARRVRPPLSSIWPMIAVPAGAMLAWGIWVALHQRGIDPALALGYGSYAGPVRQAGLSAIRANVPDLSRPLEVLVLGWIPIRWLYEVLATLAVGIGLYGLVLLSRRSAIGLTLVLYLVILAVWPYPPDRFLWAVLPWLALAWAAGAVELWRRWPRLRLAIALFAAVLAAGYVSYEVRGFSGRWWDTEARAISANFAELLPVITNLPADAVIAGDDEPLLWLYSRRKAVPLYLESYRGRELVMPTPAEHRAYLERMGVTHVLLASTTSPSAIELRSLLAAYPTWLTALYRWSDGRWLFAVNRGP
jgi:hypothetical protein